MDELDTWELLPDLLGQKYHCFDCNTKVNIDFWLVINKCLLVCQNCALIHLKFGSHLSNVKYLSYPPLFEFTDNYDNCFYWSTVELNLLKYCLANTALKSLWYKEPDKKDKNINRHSWNVNSQVFQDKGTQIDLGSLSTLSHKSLSFENFKLHDEIYINNVYSKHESTIKFQENPLYAFKSLKQDVDYSELIKVKYILLSFFDYKFIHLDSDDPLLRFEMLNYKLIQNVSTPCLKRTLACLTLGADPNIIVRYHSKITTPLDEALETSQMLQAYLLIAWGANTIINKFLLEKNSCISDVFMFALTDKLYQFIRYVTFENGLPFFANQLNNEFETSIFRCLVKKLEMCKDFDLLNLIQDLYSEITRREYNLIVSLCIDTLSYVCYLPVNPSLPTARNEFRQKLCRLPEPGLKKIGAAVLATLSRKNRSYDKRYRMFFNGAATRVISPDLVSIPMGLTTYGDGNNNVDLELRGDMEKNYAQINDRIDTFETNFTEHVRASDVKVNKLYKILTRLVMDSRIDKIEIPISISTKPCEICSIDGDQPLVTLVVSCLSQRLRSLYEATNDQDDSCDTAELYKKYKDFHAFVQHLSVFHKDPPFPGLNEIDKNASTLVSYLNGDDLKPGWRTKVFGDIRTIAQTLKTMHL